MAAEEAWLIELRAEALAKLLLTEREDLDLVEGLSDHTYDLLVRVNTDETTFVPEFAVEVKGTRELLSSTVLRSWLDRSTEQAAAQKLPRCLFVFDVVTRKGKFCWLQEPVVSQGVATLRPHWEELLSLSVVRSQETIPTPPFTPLNLDTLGEITSSVVTWTKKRELNFRHHARAS